MEIFGLKCFIDFVFACLTGVKGVTGFTEVTVTVFSTSLRSICIIWPMPNDETVSVLAAVVKFVLGRTSCDSLVTMSVITLALPWLLS